MSQLHRLFLAFIFALLVSTSLHAQGLVHGHLGGQWDENYHSAVLSYGGGVVWPVFPDSESAIRGLGLAFEIAQSTGFPAREGALSRRTAFTGGIIYAFRVARVAPFASVDFGVMNYSLYPVTTTVSGSPRTTVIGALALGLAIPISDGWRIRPKLRAYTGLDRGILATDGSKDYVYEASVGFGYEW